MSKLGYVLAMLYVLLLLIASGFVAICISIM